METRIKLEKVKEKLKSGGYSGLYSGDECACDLKDFAPCGECEEDGDYINDCHPGYKHTDPTRPDFFVISLNKEPPDQGVFDRVFESC